MATYDAGTIIEKFVDKYTYPERKWDVVAYKANVVIDSTTDIIEWDQMQKVYGAYQHIAVTTKKYDMVTVKEYKVVIPS